MVEAGIVDPAKVTRSALTECYQCCFYTSYNRSLLYTTIKEDAPAMPAGAAGMGGMM